VSVIYFSSEVRIYIIYNNMKGADGDVCEKKGILHDEEEGAK
jgi:hypothetical protein